jgi:glutamyl-tRNA synthetase
MHTQISKMPRPVSGGQRSDFAVNNINGARTDAPSDMAGCVGAAKNNITPIPNATGNHKIHCVCSLASHPVLDFIMRPSADIAMSFITRFAPSPTGYLHIGGARTALFNYLFSRRYGGKFLLRIEDTDRERYSPEAVDAIFDGLKWLGLYWDDEPIFQFPRAARHAEVANIMLVNGHAYKCYATADELAAMREAQKAAGQPQRYDGRWRDRSASDAPADSPYVIRLKAPTDGATTVHDLVQGEVTVQNTQLDDMVLLRSDGTPTYMLAVVVDDHDMHITHVIRGDDHLTNTFRQVQIYQAMGWEIPKFSHIPLIHGADGQKLSKRHGAVNVAQYREEGYLPIAMRNYLVRLGWGHGDQEIFSDAELLQLFDLDGIGRAPARFDYDKLGSINNYFMRIAEIPELAAQLQKPEKFSDASFAAAIDLFRERAKTLLELQNEVDQLASTPIDITIPAEAQVHLQSIAQRLSYAMDAELIEKLLKDYVTEAGVPFKLVGQNMRLALTGSPQAPAIGKLITILGIDESLQRIQAAIHNA